MQFTAKYGKLNAIKSCGFSASSISALYLIFISLWSPRISAFAYELSGQMRMKDVNKKFENKIEAKNV